MDERGEDIDKMAGRKLIGWQTGVVDDHTGSADVTAQCVHTAESVSVEAKSTEVRAALLVHVRACSTKTTNQTSAR